MTLPLKSKMPEYRHWINMRSRCNTPSSTGFEFYGGRGIQVSPEWNASFEAFFADMGPKPGPGYSIDRINPDKDYSAPNCRWATKTTQARNTRSNHYVVVFGHRLTITEIAEAIGMKPNSLTYRLKRGWSLERAVATPMSTQGGWYA